MAVQLLLRSKMRFCLIKLISRTCIITCCLLSHTGARAETSAKVSSNQGYENEGVRGLKALGVRDLNYRMAYLACTVTSTNARVSVKET